MKKVYLIQDENDFTIAIFSNKKMLIDDLRYWAQKYGCRLDPAYKKWNGENIYLKLKKGLDEINIKILPVTLNNGAGITIFPVRLNQKIVSRETKRAKRKQIDPTVENLATTSIDLRPF